MEASRLLSTCERERGRSGWDTIDSRRWRLPQTHLPGSRAAGWREQDQQAGWAVRAKTDRDIGVDTLVTVTRALT
eukprot:5284558-Prymnesium_polylepis.1